MIKFRKTGKRGSLALAAAGAAASVGLALGLASTAAAAPASGVSAGHFELCAEGNYSAFALVPVNVKGFETQIAVKGKCSDDFYSGEANQVSGIVVAGEFNDSRNVFFISVVHANLHDGVTVVVKGTTGRNGNDARVVVP